MNTQELKSFVRKIQRETRGVWSAKADALTRALKEAGTYFEEVGSDADWHVNVVLNCDQVATIRWSGGFKVSVQ